MIERVNPYYAAFKTFRDRDRESEEDTPILYLTILNPLRNDPRRYNRPTSDEVACVYVADENEPSPGRHIQVYLRGGGVRNISELHSAYLPLHFTLIYPHGEPGWHPRIPLAGQPLGDDDEIGEGEDIEDGNAGDGGLVAEVRRYGRGGSKRVTQAQFATYYLFKRSGNFNTALYCGRLFQELLVDQWAQTESNRLRWIRENQTTLRAESYKGLVDAVDAGIPLVDVGKKVVLPSTFAGSPRQMHALYQDAMAIVSHVTKPDLFVTITCNPTWTEITQELEPGQTAQDRPDLVSRVFALKLDAMLHEFFKLGVLGKKVVARIWVIEFQKRGLPHCHLLMCLAPDDKPRTPADPVLFKVVTSCMLHTCSDRCQAQMRRDGRCSKKFPWAFQPETTMEQDGYPVYRRRDNGRSWTKNRITYTNQHVVPYNPYLSARFNAHINVEVCTSISAVKYMFKYVYKGHDRANVAVVPNQVDLDEINRYIDARWVSASVSRTTS
ncbi:hypothetical protein TREMEDRAFT_27051 [Tremella mesenterica DSM 1558]|uniref:uncharacterized protein n=1 Tax=Tremella mesenterica (strain ATCC 24925 / CBS 8224 / DSM 1558 / NBRC 9311 / NRRL Y-6157 / RJB 2259-6 / UBC 559-6) TaxID=578456 RepID=UPI0003F48EB6|nr:uncharacterized protein TREMEDRAFT_27051 [Tremella mesenterica DSM 1558]EIW71217.1 hypothetical protein TREMEDRAFT_27051 [Tremella mesenterica DSM 1558]